MFKKVLVANRGEIACRVIRSCKRLGIATVAVHSDVDGDALHVRMADEAVPIGPAMARESYLSIERIVAAARRTGAEAVHPGYGFLSENADFAEACAAAGLVFIGPPPSAIRSMGLKGPAKDIAVRAGVPVVPGYQGADQSTERLQAAAEAIGWPILIKPIAGGGGKGMRRIDGPDGFARGLASSQREAQASCGDPRVLIEKYLLKPRHVEVQIAADGFGNVVHLFERDCSIQRRHQKIIEESPAPGMTAALRARMTEAAKALAREIGYVGVGTVEFLVDAADGLREDGFYFIEMNTRLQVEHPVTEMITGLDLVELQFRVAAGERLPVDQDGVACRGHAVEARICAEDPARGFLPSPGRIRELRFPEGDGRVRVDTGVRAGDEVTVWYDPMLAKLIVHGDGRDDALDRMARALDACRVEGVASNVRLLHAVVGNETFRAGEIDTGFLERSIRAILPPKEPVEGGPGVTAA